MSKSQQLDRSLLEALDTMTANTLAREAGLVTVSDLVRFVEAHGLNEVARLRWIGPKSFKQITDLLAGLDEGAGVKTFVAADGQVLRGQPVSITDLLAAFRAQLEEEAEAPLEALDLNAALLLSDLCRHLGLSDEKHDRVLGEQAAAFVSQVQGERPTLRVPPEAILGTLARSGDGDQVWLN